MGFPSSVIPGLFRRKKEKALGGAPSEKFDVSDEEAKFKDEAGRKTSAEMAAENWKNADPKAKDLIILGLEVAIRDIAKERPDGTITKKLDTLVAARDLLWANR
jgi:hypothetical protein